MALLTHWETLDDKRIALLKKINDGLSMDEFYMGGGTGLSLQMGLRKSVDFDFFSPSDFNADHLYERIISILPDKNIKTINVNNGTCDLLIDDIQVSFFHYPYPILRPYVHLDELTSIAMAHPYDIAAMKVSAIGGRGAKKDFFDLYEIIHKTEMSVQQLAECVCDKFGTERNYAHMCMGLSYFEDADYEKLCNVYVPYDWNLIKKYFESIQPEFVKEIEKSVENAKNQIEYSFNGYDER